MRWVFLFLLYKVRHLALSKVVVGVLSSSLAYLEDVPYHLSSRLSRVSSASGIQLYKVKKRVSR